MKKLLMLTVLMFLMSAPVMAEPCPAFEAAMADIEAALDAASHDL